MWIDVQPGDWYYNEIMEASRLEMADGEAFVGGIGYNVFDSNAPYVMEEYVASAGQVEFQLPANVTPTPDNPLYVYVDSIQTMYKELKTDGGTTKVVLYTPPGQDKLVTIASYGKPLVDKFFKPSLAGGDTSHPMHTLSKGGSYVYDPFNRHYRESVYAFGKQLRRVNVDESEWTSGGATLQSIASKYIGQKLDRYIVSPSGVALFPYNLNNTTVTMVYLENAEGWAKPTTEKFKPTSPRVIHNNRFFPKAYITRAEAFVFIDRLRRSLYSRFTDIKAPTNVLDDVQYAYQGQKMFRINGYYPCGNSDLEVYVNDELVKLREFDEIDSHTIVFKEPLEKGTKVRFKYSKEVSTRFYDVGNQVIYATPDGDKVVNGDISTTWWAPHVLALEDETFSNGEFLVNGLGVNVTGDRVQVDNMYNPLGTVNDSWFMAQTCLTRAEAVAFLNRFRKWCIERLK